MSQHGDLVSVGWWRHGEKTGTWWTRVSGGGWHVTNTKSSQSIFIYPDLVTALLGDIDQDCVSLGNLDVCHIETLGFESGIILPGLGQKERSLPVTKSKIQNVH